MLIKIAELFKKPEQMNWKFYRGKVIDNKDPKKMKRVKVNIEGILEGSKNDMPWVMAFTDVHKRVRVPEEGEYIVVIFPFDDIYHPFYLGYWNTGDSTSEYLQDDYPDTFGFIETGLKMKFNKKTKAGEAEHSTGTKAMLKEDGSIEMTIKKDLKFVIEGKFDKTVTGDYTVSTDAKISLTGAGGVEINSDAEVKINGAGGVDIQSDAMVKLIGKGGTTVGSSSSQTMVDGSMVLLGGGGAPICVVGSQGVGAGNLGAPVVVTIIQGSAKVFSA